MHRATQFCGALACLLAASDCALKGSGVNNQAIFAPEHLWLWWLAIPGWLATAYLLVVGPR